MNPVEAVARALAQRSIHERSTGFTVDTVIYDGHNRPVPYWHLFIPDARAALAAIRTPTAGMIEAMSNAAIQQILDLDEIEDSEIFAIWHAAIDAAMEE